MQVLIRFGSYSVEAEIYDTPTGKAVLETLPLTRNVIKWGQEIFFEVPASASLENGARAEVEIGDLAYWPNMPAFCIFFGPTPVSPNGKPRAASSVNVFGRLLKIEADQLDKVPEGENVTVELLTD